MSGLRQVLQNKLQFAGGSVQIDSSGIVNITPLAGQVTKITGALNFQTAASQIIPGATSFSLRNNANSRDNFIVQDAGTASLFGALSTPSIKDATGVNSLALTSNTLVLTNNVGSSINLNSVGDIIFTPNTGRIVKVAGRVQNTSIGNYIDLNNSNNILLFQSVASANIQIIGTPGNIGTFWSLIASNGGAGGTGGSGGSILETAGAGDTNASGNAGIGGHFIWTSGVGGNSTGATAGNHGGTAGYFSFVGHNGGGSTNGNGANGSSLLATGPNNYFNIAPGFNVTLGNGGGTTDLTSTYNGGVGASVLFTTGNAGSVPNQSNLNPGGDFVIVLGQGNGTQNVANVIGNGRNGNFQVWAPIISGATPTPNGSNFYPTVTINSLGLGIGSAAYQGVPFAVSWYDTDPAYDLNMGAGMYPILNSDNSHSLQSWATTIHIGGPGGNTFLSGSGGPDNEVHILSTGTPNFAYLRGTYNSVRFDPTTTTDNINFTSVPTAATADLVYGTVGQLSFYGSGLIGLANASYGSIVIEPNATGTVKNQSITNGYAFQSQIIISGTVVSPNNSIFSNAIHYYAPQIILNNSTTAVVTSIWSFLGETQHNTYNSTTSDASLTLVAGGAKLTVGNQSATAAATVTNYGLYVTGNGGTFSGGANGNNWAIYSDSTAASQLAGLLGLSASTSARASLNIPHGTAPSSPVNGDIWTTSAGGLYVRINGATIGPLT